VDYIYLEFREVLYSSPLHQARNERKCTWPRRSCK